VPPSARDRLCAILYVGDCHFVAPRQNCLRGTIVAAAARGPGPGRDLVGLRLLGSRTLSRGIPNIAKSRYVQCPDELTRAGAAKGQRHLLIKADRSTRVAIATV
jgi:hypothetical protein